MRDCENVDVRDRLPDLLNERLGSAERALVEAHVRECVDCSAELALLREARTAVRSAAPDVDVAAIARAVQDRLVVRSALTAAPIAAPVQRGTRRTPRWSGMPLRAAAAVVLMAVGAGGVLVARRGDQPATVTPRVESTTPIATPTAPTAPTAQTEPLAMNDSHPAAHTREPAPASSALGATFSDLSDAELAAVIRELDGDATLPVEPAPTPAVVGTGGLE